jgi:uncharacterized DUF497 family protein
MRFEWDEAKRLRNLKDHGIDFVDAPKVFDGPTFTFEDDRFPYREQRFVTLGLLEGMPVSIAHTETDEVIRPISFRRATTNETTIFFEKIADELPTAASDEGQRRSPHARTPRSKRKAHSPRNRPKRPKTRPS